MSDAKRQKTGASTAVETGSSIKLALRPSAIDAEQAEKLVNKPSRYQGLFERYDKFDISPYIGTEFKKGTLQLKDLLYAENSDELIRDLAVYISERGVILFRDQHLTPAEHTLLIKKIDTLPRGLKADDAQLHIHPMTASNPEHGDHFVKIHSKLNKVYKGDERERSQRTTGLFHTDLLYERQPASYSALQMTAVPENGAGGTVFGSGYHAYDRLSPKLAKFLEGLTVHADWNSNLKLYDKISGDHYRESRGSNKNQGASVTADHPIVRTNPITGWKSIYYSVIHGKYINELDYDESLAITEFLERLITENHEYLIKLRWENNDLAIWDNRSTFHSATMDYSDGESYREGFRVTTLGEIPYLDPNSISLKEYEQAKKEEKSQ
jgi:alpha-ketoglutarate-dependent taurine dioxygenase